MTQREKILNAVRQNQPGLVPAPGRPALRASTSTDMDLFKKTLSGIGGQTIDVRNVREVERYIEENFKGRALSYLPASDLTIRDLDPRQYADLEVAVIPAVFGVAENGAVWVTEKNIVHRAIPFICEHLAVVLRAPDVLPTMHEAYERIGAEEYNFGVFIAGPSKTADIEQSLVLGAHGAKSFTLFILNESN